MNSRMVLFCLLLLLLILGIGVCRWRREPVRRELVEREPGQLVYSREARCQMRCGGLEETDVKTVLRKGVILLNRSNRGGRPCPTFTLQGHTSGGRYLRLVFSQCPDSTRLLGCYDLKKEAACDCPES